MVTIPLTIKAPFKPAPLPDHPTDFTAIIDAFTPPNSDLAAPPFLSGLVSRVYDGDSLGILANNALLRVRLIGIDAPEINSPTACNEPGSHEAQAALALLALGMPVSLHLSPAAPANDRFGRLVAHVVRLPDRLHLNLEMIRQGHATAWPYYPHSHVAAFEYAQHFAASCRFGLFRRPRHSPDPPPSVPGDADVD